MNSFFLDITSYFIMFLLLLYFHLMYATCKGKTSGFTSIYWVCRQHSTVHHKHFCALDVWLGQRKFFLLLISQLHVSSCYPERNYFVIKNMYLGFFGCVLTICQFIFDIFSKRLTFAYSHFQSKHPNAEICLSFLSCRSNMTPVILF